MRVDLVLLHLSAVDHFHEKRVAQQGLDADLMAQVSDPASAEDALHHQNHVAAVWLDQFDQIICGGFAFFDFQEWMNFLFAPCRQSSAAAPILPIPGNRRPWHVTGDRPGGQLEL